MLQHFLVARSEEPLINAVCLSILLLFFFFMFKALRSRCILFFAEQ